MKIEFRAGFKFLTGVKNEVKKLKILKNQRYSSNECIPEQDFLLIRVLKDVLEFRRVRGALFEGSPPGNQVDSLPGAFSY